MFLKSLMEGFPQGDVFRVFRVDVVSEALDGPLQLFIQFSAARDHPQFLFANLAEVERDVVHRLIDQDSRRVALFNRLALVDDVDVALHFRQDVLDLGNVKIRECRLQFVAAKGPDDIAAIADFNQSLTQFQKDLFVLNRGNL